MSNVSEFSTTAASNNSASPNGFPESMPPSGVNDSARELMAGLAKWYKDLQGTITTGGTTTAYTLTTNNAHAALNDIGLFAMQINAANTGSATLNVDSLGAKTMQLSGANMAAGDLAADEIVLVVYNPDNDVFDVFKSIIDQTNLISGQKSGLILSNNGSDSDHDIDIAAGSAANSTNAVMLSISAITKRIDATWSSGTNNGGLSSSLSAPANNTWYHVFIVRVGGADDVLFDTSLTCANGITDHSVTHYRRIGSVLTDGSANILGFKQAGDVFAWDVPVQSASGTDLSGGATATLSVPTGIEVEARGSLTIGPALVAGTYYAHVTSYNSSTAASASIHTVSAVTTGTENRAASGSFNVLTDTSARVRADSSAATAAYSIHTYGWRDFL